MLREIHARICVSLEWETNDIVLVDNMLIAHGFEGDASAVDIAVGEFIDF
jgi:alpha-ketoglutarate-dependent taurine dioxygenase